MNYQSFLEMNVLISDPLLLALNQNKFTLIFFLILTAILFYVVANALVRLISFCVLGYLDYATKAVTRIQ